MDVPLNTQSLSFSVFKDNHISCTFKLKLQLAPQTCLVAKQVQI